MWFERNWELIDKTILPSGFEQLAEASFEMERIKSENANRFFRKTLVLTFKCSLTGKIKTTVVRS